MRYCWLALAGLFGVGTGLQAQPQNPPRQVKAPANGPRQAPAAALDPASSRLDALLAQWEKVLSNVQTLQAQCIRTEKDRVFGDVRIFEGWAKYMKPNLALLYLTQKGNPKVFERYVCTGTLLYQYAPARRVIYVHELPPPKARQLVEDNFLSFIFGMKAAEARQRYDLTLSKEDENWIYIAILPRRPEDKADFQRAQLVLSAKTFLPRRLWFEQLNKNEITWDLPQVVNGARINRNEFVRPDVPPGWRMEKAVRMNPSVPRKEPPPRIVRPNQ